ncbi:MAG: selenide, water dikinase SelD [Actinomycetota bacterium]
MSDPVRLTSFSHGAGCACKLGPGDLATVMGQLAHAFPTDPALLVGTDTGDDAAVYRLDDRTALVFTTDFFTPIVDDPFDWGRVAAANAMSDVYAMGGRPILCLNLVGWPIEDLPLEMLARVLDGGAIVAGEAGALVAGGHTIDDREPHYGMAVVGLADPDRIVTNAAARPGDVLVLTKPLGIGATTTAIKRGLASEQAAKRVVDLMTHLNRNASEAMLAAGITAATDVTGFGLLGHLHKMLLASGAAAEVWVDAVPVLDEARDLVVRGAVAGGTKRNMTFVAPAVDHDDAVAEEDRILLADAQTSGGLLIACPPGRIDTLRADLEGRGEPCAEIGHVVDAAAGRIAVRQSRT